MALPINFGSVVQTGVVAGGGVSGTVAVITTVFEPAPTVSPLNDGLTLELVGFPFSESEYSVAPGTGGNEIVTDVLGITPPDISQTTGGQKPLYVKATLPSLLKFSPGQQ
jgi:hypothetical protein